MGGFIVASKYENWVKDMKWHSSMDNFEGQKSFCNSLPNNKKAKRMFIATDSGKLLIHKTTRALWRVSEDGKAIEPVFDTDVLSEQDIE